MNTYLFEIDPRADEGVVFAKVVRAETLAHAASALAAKFVEDGGLPDDGDSFTARAFLLGGGYGVLGEEAIGGRFHLSNAGGRGWAFHSPS